MVRRASRLSRVIAWCNRIISAPYRPWIVRAALMRSSPSAVLGPVLLPPCILHLPFGIAGCRHGVSLRVCAPHRGQDCASGSVVRQSGRRDMGFFQHFLRTPSPPSAALDISDNRFSSGMDVNMLDADNLLTTLSTPAVERR